MTSIAGSLHVLSLVLMVPCLLVVIFLCYCADVLSRRIKNPVVDPDNPASVDKLSPWLFKLTLVCSGLVLLSCVVICLRKTIEYNVGLTGMVTPEEQRPFVWANEARTGTVDEG